jgi:hypothetical protein
MTREFAARCDTRVLRAVSARRLDVGMISKVGRTNFSYVAHQLRHI